jgi:Uma2 family endonuclease
MTVTVSVPHDFGRIWTIDDLHDLPDDGNRYEIADGSLLVSRAPSVSHGNINDRLRRILERQAPTGIRVLAVGVGIDIHRPRTYYIPDLLITTEAAIADNDSDNLQPADVLLVAEVLSPSNAGKDLVQKRHDYAAAGIPRYWIVDPRDRTVTVLTLPAGATGYEEETVVRAGEPWDTGTPYPLTVDPAEIF